ncbi:MAG TPA: adenylosuccinate synthase [Blastocatellia bacterium]|nr:adenylosuccinate synthase [Blastocatellia bacterium]
MKNVVVVGAQWGDEGKGKVVDILAPHFDLVARYQGGHNAGHTVRIGDRKFILRLIPSGILHDECQCLIGNGVVVDPTAFNAEIQELKEAGVECEGRLFISARAHLILPYHVALDRAREERLGANSVGTTMRGIGPAYEDKASRCGVRAGDLLYPDLLREKIRTNIEEKNLELASLGADQLDLDSTLDQFLGDALRLKAFVRDSAAMVNKATQEGKSVLVEGAQGTMLDVDHGTYPFVTSSNATAGGAATGLGLAPRDITGTLGIAKAYTTRVGGGPFPTELLDEHGAYLQKRGNEYGAVTGRPRRTGWFDAVVVRYSVMLNGFDAIALTKLDVLDEFDEIKIATGYRCRGESVEGMPYGANVLAECEPIYESVPGWKTTTSRITKFDELPAAARDYVGRIEELCGTPIGLISTGPDRNETIIREGLAVSKWMSDKSV